MIHVPVEKLSPDALAALRHLSHHSSTAEDLAKSTGWGVTRTVAALGELTTDGLAARTYSITDAGSATITATEEKP